MSTVPGHETELIPDVDASPRHWMTINKDATTNVLPKTWMPLALVFSLQRRSVWTDRASIR